MVGTRSRTYSNNVVLKRKYTKRKTVQSNQNDPSEFHQANEKSNETSVQVDPTNSMHLELDESLNNDNNNDLTIDEYDRVVSRNRVISSEDEIVVEKKPKEYKNSLKGAYIFLYLLIYCLIN
jgi:hypothetical protein